MDRQPLFVAAIAKLLRGLKGSADVLTASRSDAAVEIARTERVDLICCELDAEPLSGLELLEVMSQEMPHIPVILLGEVSGDAQLAAAMAANAAGLFTKGAEPEEFLAGVSAVVSGHRAIGSGVIGQLMVRFASPGLQEARRPGNHLSPTELEILAMIGRAQSIPDIAASRGISHKTVRNHLAKIYRKLELHGRTEAMLWAARMGLTAS